MNRSIIFKVLMALVLVGALAAIGVFAYNAGLARGMATSLPAPATGSSAPAPLPYPYAAFWHAYPFGFGGFGCFGVLVPLFLLFLVFAAFRGLFWHGPQHWHRMHYGPWSTPPSGGTGADIPPVVAEWHRRMHNRPQEKQSE